MKQRRESIKIILLNHREIEGGLQSIQGVKRGGGLNPETIFLILQE